MKREPTTFKQNEGMGDTPKLFAEITAPEAAKVEFSCKQKLLQEEVSRHKAISSAIHASIGARGAASCSYIGAQLALERVSLFSRKTTPPHPHPHPQTRGFRTLFSFAHHCCESR